MSREPRKKWTKPAISLLLTLALCAGLSEPQTVRADAIWDRWQAADAAVKSGKPADAVPHWKFLVDFYASKGDWENAALFCGRLDEYFDSIKQYDEAIRYYELENTYWLKAGKDWGAVKMQRAEQIRTTIEAYMSVADEDTLRREAAPAGGKLAKFEPEYGLYIGMYSEQDPEMLNYFTRAEKVYGKPHAIFLAYSQVGKEFPKQHAMRAKEAGAALQIGWEPTGGLDTVADNDYLRRWARDAKASGIPIFLRYASEMNGDWVPWHGDPQKYIEKFRLVHDVMAEEAPNVAMVWSPGDVPAYSMHAYYPGDDYVDWVGVSLYTEPYENGDPQQANMQGTSPVERLDELYRTYADRKPLMISETAVSHYAHIPEESFTDWALMNMDRLYNVMPHKYPRLKAITWYNVDLKDRESRNNYLLSANPELKAAYAKLISSPFYLSKVENGAKPADGVGFVKLGGTAAFAKKTTIHPFVKIPDIYIGKLEYSLNGKVIATRTEAPYGIELEAGQVPDGSVFEIAVYNKNGEKAGSSTFPIRSQVSVAINGADQKYEQPPVIISGSTMAPLRAIFESFGAAITWDAATQTATARKGDATVVLKIGDKRATVGGKTVELETPAQLVNGFTMAPARFVGEAFGGTVSWDGASRTVQIKAAGLSAAAGQSGVAPSPGDKLSAAAPQGGGSTAAGAGGPASAAAAVDAAQPASPASSATAGAPGAERAPGISVPGLITGLAKLAAALFKTVQALVTLLT
ncbi:stalk domain-containing protein [Paenibacillus hamazuiensis]|uniref:stalk domain-containing protein n=1 Tax=Paenibacillus hamazuiensis TaxID=2936508 RepID=UPI00200C5F8B|nr:stalk domain-containing protein [Paenibacillus hamazuiensis]